ncbi:MAG: hypothetical protein PHT26_12625 [Lentimicrobiaceae bacterium]|nr:hypothetical protein [Lentimicrobiaceae bacterium]
MKKTLITAFFIGMFIHGSGQINAVDSTVQVIAYWDKLEKQTFSISNEKVKIQAGDTITRDLTRYEVDITVLDSTQNEYVLNWYYHDYVVESDNEMIMKLSSIIEHMNVQIKTDEMGTLIEVINWHDIRDFIYKGTSMLKQELKDIAGIEDMIQKYEVMYNSKEAIEANAINEISQFHYFHGLNYKMWEEHSYDTQLANMYGGAPFDASVEFWLDDINNEEDHATFRMQQTIDSVQLTDETYRYLSKMAGEMQITLPSRAEFPAVHHQTWLASVIHESGWPLYSVQTREITSGDIIQSEECIIFLK